MAKLFQIVFLLATIMATVVGAYDVLLGAYYGLNANNLPPPWNVVQLCEKYNIRRVRLYEPNLDVLEAFRGMGIDISFGIPNDLLPDMATNETAVKEWFNTNIEPFVDDFKTNYIIVGDNAIPGLDDFILPVMLSLQNLLNEHYLGQIKITTLVGYQAALGTKEPPSSGAFFPTASVNMRNILKFLSEEGSPLMVSMFPFQKYFYDGNVNLNYAIFKETQPVVRDGEFSYYNLFDAMIDAFYAAIEKEAIGDVTVVVGEIGWPTCGGDSATAAIAEEFNKNFMWHISSGKGTPRKPNVYLEGFIRSIFNENEMPEGESRCYGTFDVNMNPTYPLFTATT